MSEFTYEKNDTYSHLECFEWDNVWFEHTEKSDRNRVYYVGDSISCGVRRIATAESGDSVLFDGFGTSKAIDHPLFIESLKLYAKQLNRMDAIIFNNGLHGWHLGENEYEAFYDTVINQIRELYPDVPTFIVLSTYVRDEGRRERVKGRNRAALRVAEKYSLPVIDLYRVSEENSDLCSDGVHFLNDGYKLFAREILTVLKENGIE